MNAITLECVCAHIHNYFTAEGDVHAGTFTISGGVIDLSDFLIDGQYFRILGSALNDGVYKYPAQPEPGAPAILKDETFTGEIWAMKVPRAVVEIAGEIADWQSKYGAQTASPFQSENVIGVYSYSKASGGAGTSGAAAWMGVFRARLNEWRKLA